MSCHVKFKKYKSFVHIIIYTDGRVLKKVCSRDMTFRFLMSQIPYLRLHQTHLIAILCNIKDYNIIL